MKEIKLTQGKVTLVDDEWYEYLNQWKWCYSKWDQANTGYAVRTDGKRPNRQTIRMHSIIMGGISDDLEIDHRDGDGLNNQKYNLRLCTHAGNMMNAQRRKDNTSGYKGVGWSKHAHKWMARIRINDQYKNLGYFSTPEEAACAYNKAAQETQGDFARPNHV